MRPFKEVRRLIIEALRTENYRFEPRFDLQKNKLATGELLAEDVIEILKACRGPQYEIGLLHQNHAIQVHFFKPVYRGVKWYIKAYLLPGSDDPPAVFISVHESDTG